MTALVPVGDMERMARAIAASKLFGIQNPEQALALMIVAAAENRHPGSVAAEYHIIQNRPALKADAMLARFQQAGGSVAWQDYTDDKVSAVFTHPQGGSVRIEWDMPRAKKAGLGGKDNWTKYPRQMLRARVISEGVRTCFPAVCVGVYTPEEVADFDEKPRRPSRERNMGSAELVPDADDDALKNLEQPAGAPEPETAGAAPPPPATTPPQATPKMRAQIAEELCRDANINFPDATAKAYATAKVQHWDEMAESDWDSWVAMMRRGITRRMVRKTAEMQP